MSGIEGPWSSLRKSHLLDKERRSMAMSLIDRILTTLSYKKSDKVSKYNSFPPKMKVDYNFIFSFIGNVLHLFSKKERRLQISYNLIKLFNEGGISL